MASVSIINNNLELPVINNDLDLVKNAQVNDANNQKNVQNVNYLEQLKLLITEDYAGGGVQEAPATAQVFDAFSPQEIEEPVAIPDMNSVENILKNISTFELILDLQKVTKLVEKAFSVLVHMDIDLTSVMTTISDYALDIAKTHKKNMHQAYNDAMKKIREATRKAGLLGIIFGALEFVAGFALFCLGGPMAGVGVVMMLNGALRANAGMNLMRDQSKMNDKNLLNQLNNGVFSLFGDKAQVAKTIWTILSVGIAGMNSLATAASNFAQKAITASLVFVNFAIMVTGLIGSALVQEDSPEWLKELMQGASMGLAGLIMSILLKYSTLSDLIKDGTGEDISMFIHMGIYFVSGLIFSLSLQRSMNGLTVSEKIASAKTMEIINQFGLALAAFNSLLKTGESWIRLEEQKGSNEASRHSALTSLFNAIFEAGRAVMDAALSSTQDFNSDLQKVISEFAKSRNEYYNSLSQLLEEAIRHDASMVAVY